MSFWRLFGTSKNNKTKRILTKQPTDDTTSQNTDMSFPFINNTFHSNKILENTKKSDLFKETHNQYIQLDYIDEISDVLPYENITVPLLKTFPEDKKTKNNNRIIEWFSNRRSKNDVETYLKDYISVVSKLETFELKEIIVSFGCVFCLKSFGKIDEQTFRKVVIGFWCNIYVADMSGDDQQLFSHFARWTLNSSFNFDQDWQFVPDNDWTLQQYSQLNDTNVKDMIKRLAGVVQPDLYNLSNVRPTQNLVQDGAKKWTTTINKFPKNQQKVIIQTLQSQQQQ